MTEGEPKEPKRKTVWKNVFIGSNPDTGKPYFEKRKVSIKSDPAKREDPSSKTEMRPLTNEERGNYTADLVAEGMEKRDEEKERAMREARGLPPEK